MGELVSTSLPNLINGVSQQPDSLRLPAQSELQENCYSSVVEGLKDRPPTEYIGKVFTGNIGDAFVHTINRDVSNRFKVIIRNGSLIVTDLLGNIKTVTTPDGLGYLTASTPSTMFRCVTIADYTFIVNTNIVTAMSASVGAVRLKEALIFVKQGNYGSTYAVTVNGAVQATYTTSTTLVTDISTANIATQLTTQLNTNLGGSGYTAVRSGSVIWLYKSSGDFTVHTDDSQGGASLFAFKDTTPSFSALPTVAPNGFYISIVTNPGSITGTYYLQFVTTNALSFGEGSWTETVQAGIAYALDATTMPFALVHNVDDTFTFRKNVWANRTAGDIATNPTPSFVGLKLKDIFFYKNRLSFVANDHTICSQIGVYFNFFLTTVVTVVDSDRIDSSISHTKVSLINHAVPFAGQVMLFSDQTQFLMSGGATFTAKTITIDPTTEFESSPTCKPVAAGRRVFFVITKGGFDGIREYSIDLYTAVKDAVDVTGHVPKYIPAGLFKLAVSTTEDVLVGITTADPSAIYVYKYFWVGQEKLQSSWSKWTFTAGTVLDVDFVQSNLYLLVAYTDGVYLLKMNLAPGVTDTGVNYVTLLDRRVTEAQCSSSYDAVQDQTTFTLPYNATGVTMQVVTRQIFNGTIIPTLSQSGTSVVVSGNKTGTALWLGSLYTRRYVFSKFYVREPAKQQGATSGAIVASGHLQLRTATLIYSNTGFFTVIVTPRFRDAANFVCTGRSMGDGGTLIGNVNIASGRFRFTIMCKNDNTTIEVNSNSFLPMRLLGLEWEGVFHTRSRR